MPAVRPETVATFERPEGTKPIRALLLVNRKARSGQVDIGRALDRLTQGGFHLIEEPVNRASELSAIVRRNRDSFDAIIIGGGDGTLSSAADGLADAGLPLGILPMGTANDLARTLGLPLEPQAAAEVIAQGHLRSIDLGWVNGTHFFNVASIGLATGVNRRLTRKGKSRWGVLAYLFAAAQVALRVRPFAAEIRSESETIRVRTVQVAVGNGRHYGGGMVLHENSQIDDGLLHLVSLEVERWWQMIPLLPALRRGTLSRSTRARVLQGHEFEVRPIRTRPKWIHADGELCGRTPAVFRVVPRALSVFVPLPER